MYHLQLDLAMDSIIENLICMLDSLLDIAFEDLLCFFLNFSTPISYIEYLCPLITTIHKLTL